MYKNQDDPEAVLIFIYRCICNILIGIFILYLAHPNTAERKINMKAFIDRSGCIGCGLCAETCPQVFRMGDDGLAEVYNEVEDEFAYAAEEARINCPVSVITIEE